MNEKITLQDLVELLTLKYGMTKKNADSLARGFFDVIEQALSTEKYVKIKGLGTFKLTEVDSRESMNVNTGERIEIQGHTKISFTPDTAMKELINKPFSHFETVVLKEGVLLEDTPFEIESKKEETVDEKVEKVIEQSQSEVESVVEIKTEVSVEAKESIKVSEMIEPIQKEIPIELPKAEEKVEDKPEIIVQEASRSENKATFKVLIGIIVVLLVIILFGLYWIFFRQENVSSTSVSSLPVEKITTVAQVEEQLVAKEDSLLVTKDTLTTQPETVEQTTVLSEDVVYEITGTIATLTLDPGQTLVKLALKYYGSKSFWPYIVQHNPDVIKDADLVPKGATIKIPKLEPKK